MASPQIGLDQYAQAIAQDAQYLIAGRLVNVASIEGVNAIAQQWIVDTWNIYQSNLLEGIMSQVAEDVTWNENSYNYLSQVIGTLLAQQLDSLATINTNIIALQGGIGGGAPIDFTDVATALHAIDYDLAQTINSQIYAGDVRIAESVASILTPAVSQLDQNLGTLLTKIYLVLDAQARAGAGSDTPLVDATDAVASSTEASGGLQALLSTIVGIAGQVDADKYHDYIGASGQLSDKEKGPAAWNDLAPFIEQAIKSMPGVNMLVGIDKLLTGGRVTAQIVDPLMHWFKLGAESAGKPARAVLDAGAALAETLSAPLHVVFDALFEKILTGVQRAVVDIGEVTPVRGFEAARDMLSAAAIQGMHASHVATIFEMVPFFKHFGIHQVSALMADMAAFGPIAAQTWGRAIGEGVGRPAGYEMNAMMRSRLFDEFTLNEAFARRLLGAGDFSTGMSFHGYPDALISVLQENAYRRPTVRDITWAIMDASVDEAAITSLLQDAGHRDSTIAALAPALAMQRSKAQRAALLSEVAANLENGFLSEGDAAVYFDQLQVPPDARQMILTTTELKFRRNMIAEHLTALKTIYSNNVIDEQEFRMGLQVNGVNSARIDAEAATIGAKLAGKVAQAEATAEKTHVRAYQSALEATLRAQFEDGFIDSGYYELTLVQAGIDAAIARQTVLLAEAKLVGRTGKARSHEAAKLTQQIINDRTAGFVELFRKGMISAASLGQFLGDLGLADALISAIVARELARAAPTIADLSTAPPGLKAKELFTIAKATLTAQFQKGLISADDMFLGLVRIGTDPSIAAATVNLEVARRADEKFPPDGIKVDPQVAAAVRRTITATIDAFVSGKISQAALAVELQALKVSDVEFAALMQEAAEKRALKMATPSGVA